MLTVIFSSLRRLHRPRSSRSDRPALGGSPRDSGSSAGRVGAVSVMVANSINPALRRSSWRRERARRPRARSATRVGVPLASRSITLEMWIGPSRSITPPSCRLGLGAGDLLGAGVALDHVQALDVQPLLVGLHAQDATGLAAILARDHLARDRPSGSSACGACARRRAGRSAGHHSTSGASETIFMKLRSRSSRATGPNTRVPRGLFWSSMITAAFSSKAM